MRLSFKLISGKDQGSFADETFSMWSSVWTPALKELDGVERITSDDFTRHDQIGVLCENQRPIGSVSFSRVDLSRALWRADSYFKVWPVATLAALAQEYPGPQILVGCYFTLIPEFRRAAQGFSAKQLLMSLVVEHLRASSASVLVGTMRVNRGMHTLCYDQGARKLNEKILQHGVEVELIAFLRTEYSLARPYGEQAASLYEGGREDTYLKVA